MAKRFVLPRLSRATLGAMATMAVLALGAQNASAQSSWNGGTGNWNVAGNWTPGSVPNSSTTDVTITGTSTTASVVTLNNLSASVHNLSLDQYSTLSIVGTQNLNIYGSTIANAGQIQAGNDSDILLIGNGATFNLTGAGTFSLGASNTALEGSFGNENLVNQGNTIQGQGTIQALASFNNQATVNANVSAGTLTINSIKNVTNTGTLEATGGGTLFINASTVNNAGGTINAGSSSTVNFSAATINGGNLSSAGSGVIQAVFTDTLNGVTISSGTTYFLNNNSTSLTGDLINKGTVDVGNSSASSGLLVEGTVANTGTINLSGGGTINLNNAGSEIEGVSGNETLVNHDNLIQGQGRIQFLGSFQNQATVNANVSGGTLEINSINSVTNTGTLEATGGGTLLINGSTVNNAGGTIFAGPSSTVNFSAATINGGNLSSAGSGVIQGVFTDTLNGVTITSGTTYFLSNNDTYLTGDLINKGTVDVGNSSASSGLLPYGTVANNGTINLSGGGTINLNNAGSAIEGFSGNETLVNHDNLIQGQGRIQSLGSFQNQATVNANVSGGTLEINAINNVVNTGTLKASGGGTLFINGSTVNNAGGTIFAGPSSTVNFSAATINGGNLSSAGSGVIQAVFTDTLNGVTITSGTTYFLSNNDTYLTGDLINKGTVDVGNSSASSGLLPYGTVANNGTINLSGGGTINLNNAGSAIEGFSGNETLINHDNLIQGQGYIESLKSFQNGGTVSANVSGGTLLIQDAPTTNSGTFQVGSGSTLVVNGAFTTSGTVNIGDLHSPSASLFQMAGANNFVQTSGTTTLWSAGSTLSVAFGQSVNIQGGLLQGFGTIQGNLFNAGTVHPGDGPGVLTVNGNYTQNSGGILDIEIGGSRPGTDFSVLNVSGLATLNTGGLLDVSLLNGFSPTSNETFVILTSGGLSGMFADNTIQLGNVTFTVEYSPTGYTNDVVLSAQVSSVPEPSPLVMSGIAIACLGAYVACRRIHAQRKMYCD